MRGADLVVKALEAAGAKTVFSLSGNQIMPIYDACIGSPVELIHTRHEAGAVFMADAWAQLSGRVGVALVTAAPGALNAVSPLFTARQSESPVLLLTGDSSVSQDGAGAFQELDQIAVTEPLTKLSIRPKSADELGDAIATACRTALSGRPGPVHVALPFDVVEKDTTAPVPTPSDMAPVRLAFEETGIAQLRAALGSARKPVLLCGPLLNHARFPDGVEALARRLGVPAVIMESPRGLKDPALGDFAKAIAAADLIVSLGKRVDYTLGFGKTSAPQCQWIVVDPEQAELDRARRNLGNRLHQTILAEARSVVKALAAMPGRTSASTDWFDEVAHLVEARSKGMPATGKNVTPAALCAAAQRHIDRAANPIVICDGGEFGQWVQASTRSALRLINGPAGAIGGGLCYAIGAKKARPEATVFAFMGDGSVGFHVPEFETAARENIPFVLIVGNDRCWNAEHQIQLRQYGPNRLIGCELSGARYDEVVKGFGGHGEFVREIGELDAAIGRAVASGKPACVNVLIEGHPAPSGSGH